MERLDIFAVLIRIPESIYNQETLAGDMVVVQ